MITLKNKRVFVSGGAGVIGQEMIKKLSLRGAIVLAADRKSRPQNLPKNILYRQGDLNYITREELESFSPEVFIHLAASFERVAESYEFFEENFHDNVLLSHHLITLLKDIPSLKKVIFPSSYLIYNPSLYSFDEPHAEAIRLQETDPIYPRNLTGSAKLNHEIELNFIKEFKPSVQVVLARIYRGYGRNSRDVISRFVRALLRNEPITVYKKENRFDYIFAEDSAEGLLRLAESSFSGVINLGGGRSTSIEQVILELKKLFPKIKVKYEDVEMPFEASSADISLLQEVTGWKPENTVHDGIRKIIEFEKKCQSQSPKQLKNVLITSVSKKIPMIGAVKVAAKKISPEIKVFGGDVNAEAIGKYFVDTFYKMPRLSDEAMSAIIAYCHKNNIGQIIPSRDGELKFWASKSDELEKNNIKVMVSKEAAIEASLDKLKFYQALKAKNLSAIQTETKPGKIKAMRLVVKERFGAGSESMKLNVDFKSAVEHAKNLEGPIFQPYVKGDEYSVDLYLDKKGRVKGAISRRRALVVNGESQITELKNMPRLEKLCSQAAAVLGLYGHVIFQVLESKGKFYFIECNARFGGASTLSVSAGLDSFYWFLLESSGEDIGDYPFIRSQCALKQVRYPKDELICE